MNPQSLIPSLIGASIAVLLLVSAPATTRAAGRGDVDCSGSTSGQDALNILLTISGNHVNVPDNCVEVGASISGAVNGDANCDRDIDLADVLETLQLVAGDVTPPCLSTTLAASGNVNGVIGPDGGSLNATGSDGSTFALTIPAGALTGPQEIEMTPVTAISDLPFSGGFVAGVDLQPSGLLFWEPVTLTVTPAQHVSLSQETAFEISSGELSLATVLPQSGAVQMSLTHFTSAGVGSGSSADRLAITGDTPANEYANDIARITHDERQNGANPQPLTDAATAYYSAEIQPNLQRAAINCAFGRTFLPNALSWARQLAVLGAGDTYSSQIQAVMQSYLNNLVTCFNDAATRCQQHDLSGLPDMLTYQRILSVLGAGGLVDDTKPAKCAHFKLEFDSEICLSYVHIAAGGCSGQTDIQFHALDIEWGGILPGTPEAQGPLALVKATGYQASATSDGSTFQVVAGGVYLNQFDQTGKPVNDPQVRIVIQPGKPIEHWTNISGSFDASYWYDRFCAIHSGELVGHPTTDIFTCSQGDVGSGGAQYSIGGLQYLGGEFYAQKTYDRTYSAVATVSDGDAVPQGSAPPYGWELTTLKLYHEPQ